MNTDETISAFIDFYRDRGHQPILGSSLLSPPGDPVLFTSAGMHPLTPYLLGQPHPLGRRLTGVQRCLRTTDLDEVGDGSHLTVFQMLGSWSLGDYDGPQSQRWGLELLREVFGLKQDLLYATVFGGDGQVGPDTAAQRTWDELGLPVELLGPEDNWWSNGPTGPCGPDSEIHVWTGDGPPSGSPSTDGRWLELWNHVTLRYERHPGGGLTPLRQPSVDTGMGLERLLMVSQHARSVYETDLFAPWRSVLPLLWRTDPRSSRILADHLRSAIVVIGDGVWPSSTGRGYVLRRLLRRALTALWRGEGGSSLTLSDLPPDLTADTARRFGQVIESALVTDVLAAEERKFRELVSRGRMLLRRLYPSGRLTEEDYEFLRDTHGLPGELITELLSEATTS
ncbi:MAG TPA: alanine--tRNA ligase-related protein [Streptosporangiaceae bacterium]|nr:alanine--tRNA ligase-related protein [Streptosporangiaceae bacterium]HLN67506.1 alanine--tRNA ligase-related protein [Streptosporangiaceae bacterium]